MNNPPFIYILLKISSVFCGVLSGSDIWDENHEIDDNIDNARSSRVLNFFPVPVEEECDANDGRRKGTCMNTYECKMKGGKSFGFCARGFGVCCVFTSSCGQEIANNLTYFVNPDFPDLTTGMTTCNATVRKIGEEIAQLRLDFIHFNLGQPNRQNGVCDKDSFLLSTGRKMDDVVLCGLNSGQHLYFDIDNTMDLITINMNLSRKAVTRLWEIRITQIPLSRRAPTGCLQYFEGPRGTIQTMNFADNGRHLANQDYNICIRQEEEMCSIVYEPCHENAFRISPNSVSDDDDEVGSGFGSESRQMQICNDRITLPCDSDDLILMPEDEDLIQGSCDSTHCGASLCPMGEEPCRIESNIVPFTIGVHFGDNLREVNPDENLGMCLNYEQIPCAL